MDSIFFLAGPLPRIPLVTPRDRCASCPPVIRCCCFVICLRVASCHVIIRIASSCFQNLHPSRSLCSLRCPFRAHTHLHAPAPCPKYYFISGRKMFSEWDES